MKDQIVILENQRRHIENVLRSLKHGYAASISGLEGAGITTHCEYVVDLWRGTNPGRKDFSFLIGAGETDTLKLVQYLAGHILGSAMPATWALHSPSELLSRIGVKIREVGVGLIFIDRADLAPEGFIDSFMALTRSCSVGDNHVGLLLGMRQTTTQGKLFREFSFTRLGCAVKLEALDPGAIAAVLTEQCPAFGDLRAKLQAEDQYAMGSVMELRKLSQGNFTRIGLFATNLNDLQLEVEYTAQAMRKLWNTCVPLGECPMAA